MRASTCRALVATPLQGAIATALEASGLVEFLAEDWQDAEAADVVITNGSRGLTADDLARLPALRLVMCTGAGHENVATDICRDRGITVTHAPGTNDETVADHAMGLMLAIARGIPARHAGLARGEWETLRLPAPTLSGASLGIVGLGNIGAKIAHRAQAFGMTVRYTGRRPRPDVDLEFRETPLSLAQASDHLVLCCSGGPETRHLVNEAVLHALGPEGFLVNVARGSVVDTQALVAALEAGRIAGAALDVWEGEPVAPPELCTHPRVVMTPHMAGRSPASVRAQIELLLSVIRHHLAGTEIPYRVV